MQYFAHRQFLVQVEKAESDGWLETIEGIHPITKGSYIATNELGHKFVVNEKFFLDSYVPVNKVEPKQHRKPKMSPFEQEAFIKGLMEQSSMPSQFESDDYINGQRELIKE